jgi:hypothetical protein
MQWRILVYRLSAEDSRHRVGIWRELRRIGALGLQSAVWAVPSSPHFDIAVDKARTLVERAGGQVFTFDLASTDQNSAVLEALYTDEREAEWIEFCSECDKASAELHREFDKEKFTLAELDEEEQNIDRLRRWYRDLRAKDLFTAPSADEAETRFKACAELLEDFADRVYQARQQR